MFQPASYLASKTLPWPQAMALEPVGHGEVLSLGEQAVQNMSRDIVLDLDTVVSRSVDVPVFLSPERLKLSAELFLPALSRWKAHSMVSPRHSLLA